MNYFETLKKWLTTNKAEIVIAHDNSVPAFSRIWNATINCKKFKNAVSVGSIANEIYGANEIPNVCVALQSLTHAEIDNFMNDADVNDKLPIIYYATTDKFNAFIGKYILRTFSNDRKKVYMYKKFDGDRLISLHPLDDSLENFFDQLDCDNRLNEFQQAFIDEFNNDYDFFEQFCGHKLDSSGKPINDANGRPLLIQPDVVKFIIDILPKVSFTISEFPEVLSNDPNVPGFSNIYFNDLLQMKIGRIDTITEWLNSRFRPDQIDIIEKIIARSLIAHAPDIHGLYIYDANGENGKSTLLNALQYGYQKLNIKCCNMTLSGIDDKHSYVQYFGASVAFNADVKQPNFIQTDLYHHVTGGDAVTIDPKGGTPFLANVKVTPILAGNISIQFDIDKNHMSRRIFFIVMHDPDAAYLNKHTVMINGRRCWKNQHSFAQAIKDEITDWMVYCFKKHYSYNLQQNSIVESDAIREETNSICGENAMIEENIILKALGTYFDITGDVNDGVATEDLFGMFMDGTISLKQVKVETSWGKSAIKKAIMNKIKEIVPNVDVNDFYKKERHNGQRKFYIHGIRKINAAIENKRFVKNAQTEDDFT